MKQYLITGGAGFIGSHLIRKLFLEEENIRITCIDNFDPFYPADFKQLNIRDFKANPNFQFLYMDISNSSVDELADAITGNVDIIVHMAAKAGVWHSVQDPVAYQQVNVMGLQNMLEFARQKNVKHFVFASSSSVYGINDHFPWKEDEQLLPISPYAMTKLSGEMLGHVYSRLFDIRFIALRFFTVYGPSQRPDLAIHKFTRAILNDKPITVYGDGRTSRDYTYIDDIINGVMAAIKYEGTQFEIINLGHNEPVQLVELIKAIETTIGKKAVIDWLPDQPGDVPKTFADITKAKKLLGYNPSTQLNAGLKNFYDWFLENKEVLSS